VERCVDVDELWVTVSRISKCIMRACMPPSGE
jgi:hypothetical protein